MIISGSFLDGIACDVPDNNWGARDWARQFDVMKAMAVDTVIIIRVGAGESAMYRSDVLRTTLYEDDDLVEIMFRQADRTGLRMYLGLYDSEAYWRRNDWDAEVKINERLIEELWDRYQSHDSFYGWYLSHEGDMRYHQTRIWKPLIRKMKTYDAEKKILVSPRYAGVKYAGPGCPTITPEQHYKHLDFIFTEMEGLLDAAAFMDGHVNFHELEEYVRVTHDVCRKHGVAFWSNLETFDRDMPWRFPPISWIKMKHKLEVVQPFVEKIITFEAPHFLSPLSMFPSAHGLFRRYLDHIRAKGIQLHGDRAISGDPNG